MHKILGAELRRSWKGKRLLAAVLCFLCYFGAVFVMSLHNQKVYEDDLIMQLHNENTIIGGKCGELLFTLQRTPNDQEKPGQREEMQAWCEVGSNVDSWAVERQSPEYFDWQKIYFYAKERATSFLKLMEKGFYHDELADYGVDKKGLQRDEHYWNYFLTHDLKPYESPYEPNLMNFLLQIFQKDTMFLLMVVVSLLMIDQICHDYDCGTYKVIYSLPISRSKLVAGKIISAMLVVLTAFLCALALFSIVPLAVYGVGSTIYPYIVNTYDIMLWGDLMKQIVPFTLLIMLFYMMLAALFASLWKTMSNSMLCMGTLLICVYFAVRIFGNTSLWVSWSPCFYLYPIEIASHNFASSLTSCILITIVWIISAFVLYLQVMKRKDLEAGKG